MAGLADIAAPLKEEFGVTKKVSEELVKRVLGIIKEFAVAGQPVMIKGFGTFKEVTRAARSARNPQTGAIVQVPAKTKLALKTK